MWMHEVVIEPRVWSLEAGDLGVTRWARGIPWLMRVYIQQGCLLVMSWVDVWLIPKSLCCWWGGSVRWVNSLIRQLAMCFRQATFLHLEGAHSPSRLIVGRPERGFLGFVNTPSYQQPQEISNWIDPAFCTTAYPLTLPSWRCSSLEGGCDELLLKVVDVVGSLMSWVVYWSGDVHIKSESMAGLGWTLGCVYNDEAAHI